MNLHPKYRGRRTDEDQRRPKKQLTTLGYREEKYIKRLEQFFCLLFLFHWSVGVKSQTHLGYYGGTMSGARDLRDKNSG